MFAIIEIGGQQFKVEKGTKLEVGQLPAKEGSTIEINKVFLLNDNGKITIGTPLIIGAFASAKILEHKKNKKVIVFKMKAKKRYRRTKGHRQCVTKLEIVDVKATGGSTPAKKVINTIVAGSPKSSKIVKKEPATPAKKTTTAKKAATKKPAVKKTATKKTVKKEA
jgi:large subunit ribosomal protein L21